MAQPNAPRRGISSHRIQSATLNSRKTKVEKCLRMMVYTTKITMRQQLKSVMSYN